MSNHTPGPWRMEPTSMRGQFLVAGGDIRDRDGFSLQFSEGNARLIVLAPELLALAEAVSDHFEGTNAQLKQWADELIARAALTSPNSGGQS